LSIQPTATLSGPSSTTQGNIGLQARKIKGPGMRLGGSLALQNHQAHDGCVRGSSGVAGVGGCWYAHSVDERIPVP
jgi:hypothetical protein